jgi:Zn-finger nucleic acid-binding protein
MTAHHISEAEVDVCNACGGLWVDWFDGEVKKVATEVLSGETERLSRPTPPTSSLRAEAVATGACPRCTRQLTVERYVIVTEKLEGTDKKVVKQQTGADLMRCEECAGVFVSRASASLLATLPPDEAPPSSAKPEGVEMLDPLPWQKLLAAVKRILGLA